ncbi:hypothetical protein NLI96_g3716 [Meripilus lineatus]|uniref:F-box domain-containing protein n=1 Tax=Meripilus lineatus TaxID=2056292 RepID=A0AAD5V8I8_9APHY|nr:hypothetical protein NLI96_g3716 [Physisporinus lineatus]
MTQTTFWQPRKEVYYRWDCQWYQGDTQKGFTSSFGPITNAIVGKSHTLATTATPSPTFVFRLPQELLDRIVDYLHNDKRALLSASTVSWAWLSSCRYHLFRVLAVSGTMFDKISPFPQFLRIVPQIGYYTRHLSLAVRTGPSLDIAGFQHILMSCPQLKILHLNSFLGREISGMITRPPMFKLKTLIFDDDTCNSPNKHFLTGFALILQLFYAIDELHFRIPNMPLVWSATPSPPDRPIPIDELEEMVPNPGFIRIKRIITSDTDPEYGGPTPFGSFMQILRRAMVATSEDLTSFKAENWLLRNPELLRPILNEAENLTHLTLTLSIRYQQDIWQNLNLKACKHLTSIHLCIVLGAVGPFAYFGRIGPFDGDLLGTLTTLTSEVVHLSIQLEVKGQSKHNVWRAVQHSKWSDFDEHIPVHLPRLQTFTMYFSGMFWDRGEDGPFRVCMPKYIRGEMSMAARRGILRLDAIDTSS